MPRWTKFLIRLLELCDKLLMPDLGIQPIVVNLRYWTPTSIWIQPWGSLSHGPKKSWPTRRRYKRIHYFGRLSCYWVDGTTHTRADDETLLECQYDNSAHLLLTNFHTPWSIMTKFGEMTVVSLAGPGSKIEDPLQFNLDIGLAWTSYSTKNQLKMASDQYSLCHLIQAWPCGQAGCAKHHPFCYAGQGFKLFILGRRWMHFFLRCHPTGSAAHGFNSTSLSEQQDKSSWWAPALAMDGESMTSGMMLPNWLSLTVFLATVAKAFLMWCDFCAASNVFLPQPRKVIVWKVLESVNGSGWNVVFANYGCA